MRRLKKATFLILILISITGAGIFYVNTIFFPFQVKSLLVQKAKALLQRDVTIGQLFFHPGKGIVLKNIRIDQNNGDPLPLLTVKEASVGIPLPDIFWTGRMLIPVMTIQSPVIHLQYNDAGQWNFADLIARKEPATASPQTTNKKPRFSIGSINIIDGELKIADPKAYETITDISASVQIDLLRNMNFELNFLIPSHSSMVHSQGRFSMATKELNADIKAKNASIPPLLNLLKVPLWVEFRDCFLKKTALSLKYKDGEITLNGAVSGAVDLSTTETATRVDIKTNIISDDFTFKRKGPHFTLKGGFLTTNTVLTVDQSKVFAGNFKGNAIAMERNKDQFDLTGNIFGENTKMTFNGQDLTGHPQVENIIFHHDNTGYTVSGQGKITNAVLKDPDLDLKAVFASSGFDLQRTDTDFDLTVSSLTAEGVNSLYAQKAISGNLKAQSARVKLTGRVLSFDGKLKTQNFRIVIARDITLLGNPDIELSVSKNFNNNDADESLTYKGVMTLNKDLLQGVPKFDELTDLKGAISFSNDIAETNGLKATIIGSPWEVSGNVKNFKEPSVSFSAKSPVMDLALIKELFTKKLKTANIDIAGTAENVLVKYESLVFGQEPPEISASGTLRSAEITADNLPQKAANINGAVEYSADHFGWEKLDFTYAGKKYLSSGTLKNFSTPEFRSSLSGDNFSLTADGKINDRIVSLNSFKGQFHHCPFDLAGTVNFRGDIPAVNLNGTVVDGKISLDAQLDHDNNKPSNVSLEVIGLKIENLKDSIPTLESKNIAGDLSLNTKISGPLLEPANWEGSGAMTITNGKLLEIDLLKGIWKTLFSNLLVDDYKHIAFTQASGDFRIADGRISTKDLLLKSTSVDLSMSGWMDFEGKINFDVIADVRQAPIVTADAVKAVPTTIISQFAKNIVGFKLTGSLSQPQTKYKVLPFKVLKKTGDSVFLGIQGMMEDLLQ